MASMLLGSFPTVSSGTAVGSCWISKRYAKSYHASPYATKASLNETEKMKIEYPIVRHQRHNFNNHYRGTEAASTREELARSFVMNASTGDSFESVKPQDHSLESFSGSTKKILKTFYKFGRPYVLNGAMLNIASVAVLAVEKSSDISMTFFIGLLKAIAVLLPMNIYVNGVNDLADIEIDKINKPHYTAVSGEYSLRTIVFITIASLILSFGLGWIVGSPPLFWSIISTLIFGFVYSINLPLLRWKRSTPLTALYIIIDRAILIPLGVFLHMQKYVFKRPAMLPRSLIFAMVFISFFNIVVALSKDIPDVEGDEKFGVRTFAVRFGQKRTFWACVILLEMIYGGSILVGLASSSLWSKLITAIFVVWNILPFYLYGLNILVSKVLGHAFLAALVWYRSKSVDWKSKADTHSFYMFIWKLLYAEYLLIPFVR